MQLWNWCWNKYSLPPSLPFFLWWKVDSHNNIRDIDNNILNLNDSRFSEVLLFGNSSFNNAKNTFILNTTTEYIVSSKTFEVPLFYSFWYSCMAVLFTSYYYYFKFSVFHWAISYYHWLSLYIFLSRNSWIWFLV